MATPIVIVNCKTYPQATGDRAVALAQLCERMAKAHNVDIRIAVQATDIAAVASAVRIPVYAESIDPMVPGKSTGSVTALGIKRAGAKGAILNHSERYMSTLAIAAAVKLLKKERLTAIVCAESLGRLRELDDAMRPDLFSIEPPELIGGDVSVAVAQPDVVMQAVHATKVPLLIGAGVRSYVDMQIAQQLGAHGVMLSSGIVVAPHREKAFLKLLTAHGR